MSTPPIFYPFVRDSVLPSFWANQIQALQTGLEASVWVRISGQNTIEARPRLVEGSDSTAAMTIDGLWRYNTASVARTITGSPGRLAVFAVTGPNAIGSTPDPFTDTTDYSFGLRVVADGTEPAVEAGVAEHWRQIARIWWDGSRICEIEQMIGYRPRPAGEAIGYQGQVDSSHPLPASTIAQDGSLVNISDYPALFGKLGHVHNGGTDPGGGKFKLPDARGRVLWGTGSDASISAIGKSDSIALASRTPSHSHVTAAHTHTMANHVHTVGAHYHGLGTLATSSAGVHAHNNLTLAAGAHTHGPSGGGYFEVYSGGDGVGPDAGAGGQGMGASALTTSAGSHQHQILSDGAHVHTLTGSVGNTGSGTSGDATFNTGNPTTLPETGSSSPATSSATIPFTAVTWLLTTGD